MDWILNKCAFNSDASSRSRVWRMLGLLRPKAKKFGGFCAPYPRITARLNEEREGLVRMVTGRLFHALIVLGIKELLYEDSLFVGREKLLALRNLWKVTRSLVAGKASVR